MAHPHADSDPICPHQADWVPPPPTTPHEGQDLAPRFAQFWIDHAREAACSIAPDGRILYVNNAACRSLGYTREELLSMYVYDVDAGFAEQSWAEHWQNIKLRGAISRESEHRTKDGRLFPVEMVADFLEYEGEQYICALAHDITGQRHAEEALRLAYDAVEQRVQQRTAELAQANTRLRAEIAEREKTEEALRQTQRLVAVGTLAAGIAHEINNPLSAIMLSADIAAAAAGNPGNDAVVKSALENISVSARRCSQIVRGVHQFARNKELQKSPCDLGEVVQNATDAAGEAASEMGVHVEIDIGEDLPRLPMAPVEMQQVFTNLILNAIQASDRGSSVSVRSEAAADGVQVFVEDKGCGVKAGELERIFDPFYTTRADDGGTGLGLSISHGIVREHGGTIHAESTPGKGTSMRVVLPMGDREKTECSARA